MSRLGSWLRSSPAKAYKLSNTGSAAASTTNIAIENDELTDALNAVIFIFRDDMEEADRLLNLRDSPFHLLGRGVVQALRALLGFEADVMKLALEKLIASENAAWAEKKRAEKEGRRSSKIYPPGTEYSLIYAESQLLSALVAVISENVTESLKGFYKLKTAFSTLQAIVTLESKYLAAESNSRPDSKASSFFEKRIPGGFETSYPTDLHSSQISPPYAAHSSTAEDDSDSDLEFIDADENLSGTQTPAEDLAQLDLNNTAMPSANNGKTIAHDASFFDTEVDAFIHSSTTMCFGIMQLIISLLPPVMTKVLGFIGFKGDRETGLDLLWQGSRFPNFNGSVCALFLLGFYNGFSGFCDIMPDSKRYPDDILGYPRARCDALLADQRARFPMSLLWRIEEARMLASQRRLPDAIALLSRPITTEMKQMIALALFEKSLQCMFSHEYVLCAETFERCMELNTWSHCLYIYIIACCHVELYRDALAAGDAATAQKYRASAAEKLRDAPTHAGKKKFMAKQLPFDSFVERKVKKFEARAKELGCDVVECIGVSPVEEMIYLWNGHKRMPAADLAHSTANLAPDRTNGIYAEKSQANLDDTALRALLLATMRRNQGDLTAAREMLQDGIIRHDRAALKGGLKDEWVCPSAHYEMAVLCWFERETAGAEEAAKVAECEAWLKKCAAWDSYVLDTRVGIKITAANGALSRYKELSQA